MHTFYLIRHGQKQPTAGEPTLTDLGHHQAKVTAQYLKQFPISQIFASPSQRTQQTAAYIAEHFGLPVTTHELLRERANWGEDPLQSFDDFLKMWSMATTQRDYQPPVGDSSIAAGQRIEQVVQSLHAQSEHQHIALVTHGGVIADFLRNVFGDDSIQQILRQFEHGQGYHIHECSVTIVTFHEQRPQLSLLAFDGHLD